MNPFNPRDYTILIVEDHKFSRRALINMLVRAGYENLLSAQNGEEALSKLEHHKVDLIITDINMPKINGLELIKLVREGKSSAADVTSIIAVTTLSDTATIAACMTLEIDAFLVKPVTVQNAQEQIKSAVSEPKRLYQKHLYGTVSTEVNFELSITDPEPNAPRIREVSSHVFKIENLSELKEDMIVLENICAKTGGCLLKAGTKLNAKLIRRLSELSTIIEVHSFYARLDETQLAHEN
ncbi:response regulator [Vibrio sp. VPAP30]|uniref:response regulator n=1 Tax=Vibrio sp. VPAP30 TaxID=1647102 RepID=UPI000657942A|nr:response regulator [Vibrio sp. VPAP30]KLN63511.1 histidine kinase [Vibrio sp. VPAP30]